jgi:shikimate dehydrogenase
VTDKRYLSGLIGANLGNSLSAPLHDATFAALGVPGFFHVMDIDELGLGVDALPRLMEFVRIGGFSGTQVTYPCKEHVVALMDNLDPHAARIGAVNTVVARGGKLKGHNTDWFGFHADLMQRFGDNPERLANIAVVGAGGAGRAICYALAMAGAGCVRIFDKEPGKAATVAATLSGVSATTLSSVDNLDLACVDATGVVNATELGMLGKLGTAIPAEYLRSGMWVGEVIYTPLETELVIAARQKGLDVMTGDGMNLYQGIESFRLITGLDPDSNAMTQTYRDLLAAAEVRRATKQG